MSTRRNLQRILMGTCVATLCACASDTDTTGPSMLTGASAMAGSGAETEMPQCLPNYLPFSTGADNGLHPKVEGTSLEVRLLEADHQPPKKGYNTWTVAIRDAETGAPAPDAVITWACTWMQVHQHGTNPKRLESLGDGQFTLVEQNFSMFGPWEIRLWIDPTGVGPVFSPQAGSTQANGQACAPTSGLKGKYNAEFTICVPRSIADAI